MVTRRTLLQLAAGLAAIPAAALSRNEPSSQVVTGRVGETRWVDADDLWHFEADGWREIERAPNDLRILVERDGPAQEVVTLETMLRPTRRDIENRWKYGIYTYPVIRFDVDDRASPVLAEMTDRFDTWPTWIVDRVD